MIQIYVTGEEEGRAVQEKLRELVLAHRWITVQHPGEIPAPEVEQTPVLLDDGKVIQGTANILSYLEELARLKEEWDRFQSDSCYCGPDGEVE